MKILVTGGAGFIGSHLVDALLGAGYEVAAVDNLSTGFRKNLNPRAKFYEVDITDADELEKIIRGERPDIINHHAAIAEVVRSVRDPLPTFNVNLMGTVNLLRAGGEAGVKKFIFASTGGAIYGESEKIPADEATAANPLSPYGLSKLLGEEAVRFYARAYGFDYFIFRYPNVYGPRQNPKGEAGVVAIFGGLMKSGGEPKIFGDGTKTRDYLYVGDVVRANVLALERGKDDIVNLGWGREISDKRIFDAVAEATDFSKEPIYEPFREGEVMRSALDASQAKKILGWEPKIELEKGIILALEHRD